MKLSVCIDALYRHMDAAEAMRELKRLGVDTFEFWSWWDKDLERINALQQELGMQAAAFCTRFVSLVDASRREEYLDGLSQSIAAARKLGIPMLISQVGAELQDVPREKQHESLVEGLRAAAPLLEKANITLVVEPLNVLVDHPGYYLSASDEAFRICGEVGSANVKVLFDIYHQQVTEGHLATRITANLDKIGHLHAAGNPGRHELDQGEIDYAFLFRLLQNSGYQGHVGLEYFPSDAPEIGIKKAMDDLKR